MKSFERVRLDLFTDDLSIEWKLLVQVCRGSKLKYFNETWSVYRNHDTGISKWNKEKFHLSHIHFLTLLLKDDDYSEYHLEIYEAISYEMKILLDNKENSDEFDRKKLFKQYKSNEKKRIKAYKARSF